MLRSSTKGVRSLPQRGQPNRPLASGFQLAPARAHFSAEKGRFGWRRSNQRERVLNERWTGCNGITLGLLNVSLGAVVVAESEQQLFGAGLSNIDAPGWTSASLFLRGTNKDSWFLGSASFTSCVCSINVPVVRLLANGVEKLVVGAFLVDMYGCSMCAARRR